jgi:pimeloyl-ACP methyl ester carboxylesterase
MKELAIVLAHGAWADGSNWSKVIPILKKEGYSVVATQHPLTSLADDAEVVRRVVELQEGPTLLVGHSYGGAVITEAASKCPNAVGLVYIAAFAPDAGEGLGSLLGRTEPTSGAAAIRPDKYGFLWIGKEKFGESFSQDCEEVDTLIMAVAQKPISGKCFEDKATSAAWKKLPSWYQISEDDRMIPPATQHFMARRMNAKIISLSSSHASLVSHYKEVAAFILEAAKKIEEGVLQPSELHHN